MTLAVAFVLSLIGLLLIAATQQRHQVQTVGRRLGRAEVMCLRTGGAGLLFLAAITAACHPAEPGIGLVLWSLALAPIAALATALLLTFGAEAREAGEDLRKAANDRRAR